MALVMVIAYLLSAIGIALLVLSALGWCILIVEWIQDVIERRKRR